MAILASRRASYRGKMRQEWQASLVRLLQLMIRNGVIFAATGVNGAQASAFHSSSSAAINAAWRGKLLIMTCS